MKKNNALLTLYLFNGIFVFGGSLFGPLYAVYTEMIDSNILSISFSWACFLISSFIFTFLLSRIGDRVKEKEYLLMAGFLVRAVAWMLLAFATNLYFLIFVQIVLGLGEALGSPAFDALFAEHLDGGQHIKEYSDWKLISHIVSTAGTLIGGYIATLFGFPMLFFCMSTLAIIAFFGVLFQPRKLL